jgi:hypothetical protein
VNCPQCGQDFTSILGQKFCSFCGASIESPPAEPDAASSSETPESQGPGSPLRGPDRPGEEYCPWEDLDNLGFVRAILDTLQQSLLAPAAFFARMPRQGGLLNPFLYGLLIGSLGATGSYLSGLLVNNPLFSYGKVGGELSIAVGLLIPVFVAAGIAIEAILLHLAVFITGGVKLPFEATFRVVSYASGPDLFNCVPFIGWLIAMVWKFYITVLGIREVHELSTGRSILAVSLPIVLCCGLFTVTVFLAILAAHG